ncbi:MAG: zf-HC2 domain-containing protein [Propionibacteriaceae bacterium]|nr:zf-HC2 domain-containing protein [Propionibacteriaceae bacterium]
MSDLASMCSYTMMRINAFLDDELDEEAADIVRSHIADCADCLDEVDIWVAIRGAVKHAYPADEAPPALIAKVVANIHRA